MELGILIASLLLKYGPALTEEIAVLLHSDTPPTLAQWQAIFAKCKSLDQYVAEAKAALPSASIVAVAGLSDSPPTPLP